MPPSGLLGIVVATALGGGAPAARALARGAAGRPAAARDGAGRLRGAAGARRVARAARGAAAAALAQLRRCRSCCCSRARSWSASAWAWSRPPRFGRPRSPAASATRCGAPTSPRCLFPPPRSAPARSASLYLLLATIVFLQIGGVPRLVDALLSSYRALPLAGGLGEPAASRVALVVVAASAKLIVSGVALAAPVVVALWLTDLALGLIARAAPSVPVYFLGLPLKGPAGDRRGARRARIVTKRPRGRFFELVSAAPQAVAALRG